MKYTWNEYQKAKNIISVFEKERSEIQSKRQSLRYNPVKRTYYSIIWHKRDEIKNPRRKRTGYKTSKVVLRPYGVVNEETAASSGELTPKGLNLNLLSKNFKNKYLY